MFFSHTALRPYALIAVLAGVLAASVAGAALTAPKLTAPEAGAKVTLPLTVQWGAVTGAVSYMMEMARDHDFAHVWLLSGQSGTQVTVPALPAKSTMYWRVRAVTKDDDGPWSEVRSFTSPDRVPLPGPALTAPANNSTVTLPLTFQWTSVPGAARYTVQIASDQACTQLLGTQTVARTSVPIPSPPLGATSYWRVKAGGIGADGVWSDVWSFTTPTPLPPPKVTGPVAGGLLALPILFRWTAVEGATSYTLQVARDQAFTKLVGSQTVSGTSYPLAQLPMGIVLYWRVEAAAQGKEGTWSDIQSFAAARPQRATPARRGLRG